MWQALAAPSVFDGKDEPRIVSEYLRGAGCVFVEVGAFEPIALSQTYHLEQEGWSGILVEPLAEHAAALRLHRKARVFETACGAPENHGKLMPIRVAGSLSTMRTADLAPELADKEVRDVRVVTLDCVLAEAGVGAIDFLSIDVEDVELDVLRGFSIEKYRPRLVLIEDFSRTLHKHRYMVSRGYKLVRRSGLNSWYVPAEAPFAISLYGRWQLVRKYYLAQPFRWLQRQKKRLLQATAGRGLTAHRRLPHPAPVRP
jgi:FkbM family methyltransferase